MKLLELADKLERHTLSGIFERDREAAREMNEAIAAAIGLPATVRVGHEILGNERVVPARLPDYVASLDAAMMLVPEGWACSMHKYALPKNPARVWQVCLEDAPVAPFKPTDFRSAGSEAPTLALALCAAALRARVATPPEGEER